MNNSIDPVRFGLAGGLLWGVSLFLLTLVSLANGYGKEFLDGIVSIYPGFSVSVNGSLIGFLYGFVDLFAAGFVFAWLYNLLGKRNG